MLDEINHSQTNPSSYAERRLLTDRQNGTDNAVAEEVAQSIYPGRSFSSFP